MNDRLDGLMTLFQVLHEGVQQSCVNLHQDRRRGSILVSVEQRLLIVVQRERRQSQRLAHDVEEAPGKEELVEVVAEGQRAFRFRSHLDTASRCVSVLRKLEKKVCC